MDKPKPMEPEQNMSRDESKQESADTADTANTANTDGGTAGSLEADGGDGGGGTEVATLGAGCFWCIEAVFEQLDGVKEVSSGYMGGGVDNPTYEEVCSGRTGHAEVVQVTFDPQRISFGKLLDYFWKLHDPTTLNRQDRDVGTQYRSVIFYHSEAQREAAEKSKQAIGASGTFRGSIVTEISEAGKYFKAENYHQDYYRLNKTAPYCRSVIVPKLDKLGLER